MAASRIVHLALKVDDLDYATKFYEQVFGFKQIKTEHKRQHSSRHMTDGHIDFTLVQYDNEDHEEALLSGPGPRLHHYGVSVDDQDEIAEKIRALGGEILSPPGSGALKFRAPDGTIAEIVKEGRYSIE
ncbi:VOC family protein [Sodalis ligni]|uniref:VOC family protein n=1 Tax=Sodalis ligni TaxID=2697027 RepID=UPI00193FA6D5|nr:VOC family protein [Sodalis ligni]QWA12970.1 VOC family protein [Sodalis ligni]